MSDLVQLLFTLWALSGVVAIVTVGAKKSRCNLVGRCRNTHVIRIPLAGT